MFRVIKIKKSFKWLNPLSSQSCPTLICLQVFIAFLTLRKISSWNYVLNDPFLCFIIVVALLVGPSFPSLIMLLEFMLRRHILCLFLLAYFFHSLDQMRCADAHETLSLFSNKNLYGFIKIYIFAEFYI